MLPWRSVSAQNIDLSALLVSCKFPRNIILKYNCIENLWGSLLGDASAMFLFQVDSKENTIPMSQWFKDNILRSTLSSILSNIWNDMKGTIIKPLASYSGFDPDLNTHNIDNHHIQSFVNLWNWFFTSKFSLDLLFHVSEQQSLDLLSHVSKQQPCQPKFNYKSVDFCFLPRQSPFCPQCRQK